MDLGIAAAIDNGQIYPNSRPCSCPLDKGIVEQSIRNTWPHAQLYLSTTDGRDFSEKIWLKMMTNISFNSNLRATLSFSNRPAA